MTTCAHTLARTRTHAHAHRVPICRTKSRGGTEAGGAEGERGAAGAAGEGAVHVRPGGKPRFAIVRVLVLASVRLVQPATTLTVRTPCPRHGAVHACTRACRVLARPAVLRPPLVRTACRVCSVLSSPCSVLGPLLLPAAPSVDRTAATTPTAVAAAAAAPAVGRAPPPPACVHGQVRGGRARRKLVESAWTTERACG